MYRKNTPADVANTGRVQIDAGDGVVLDLPVVAEDLEDRVVAVEETVDKIKLANQSMGTGAPTGTAPIGWHYTDLATGDIYRMEA